MATLGAILALVVEMGGRIALLKTRIAAFVLAGFTVVASVFFHALWSATADQAFVQQLLFFKNIAVAGGLLILATHGETITA